MDLTLRLLIVANDPLARMGLATLLAELPNCVVIGQATSDGFATLEAAEIADEEADVVIWDLGWETAVIDLPDPGDYPAPIIALVAEPDEVGRIWATGVQGLLNRQLDADKLLAAAQAVAEGLVVVEPELMTAIMPASFDGEETTVELTPRESDVLQLMAEGLTNKAIGQRLDITNHTVKFHVNAIMTKLHAQSRTEAVVRATRQGLILL